MFQDIHLDEVLALHQKQQIKLIDVRSPSEFRDWTIPGSINIPVFNDEERAEVGTIYKQESTEAAKKRGLEIMSAKLPQFIEKFKEVEGPKAVFCWRGGMRSKTAATVVDLMGMSVSRLVGGIRTYRSWVVDTLNSYHIQPESIALNGYTGSGKTIILHELRKKGYPVIDLEGMAQHRGSVFGQIGLTPNNQKKFDSLLLEQLIHYQSAPYILFEAESKRIGKVALPDFLSEKKSNGIQIFIDMPVEERVKIILEDYEPWKHHQENLNAFDHIKKRIHTPIAKEIETALHSEDYATAVRLLLEYYYDPRYDHTRKQYADEKTRYIKVDNIEDAIASMEELLAQMNMPIHA
ncbi:tRNA 2-selenouridine(34) synthase MnmH [Sediminibacillus massiliensis]|uniref:tRNA 2-selenouridine(34) synthase MnmH n=1 Tax=Sediminibacillus massiliensis TaxID=1926277 RepID=UPI000988734D|nr:tRNA 2-selenouridine(34) synthase MnmH [Sediminibacillus massiliensis]